MSKLSTESFSLLRFGLSFLSKVYFRLGTLKNMLHISNSLQFNLWFT